MAIIKLMKAKLLCITSSQITFFKTRAQQTLGYTTSTTITLLILIPHPSISVPKIIIRAVFLIKQHSQNKFTFPYSESKQLYSPRQKQLSSSKTLIHLCMQIKLNPKCRPNQKRQCPGETLVYLKRIELQILTGRKVNCFIINKLFKYNHNPTSIHLNSENSCFLIALVDLDKKKWCCLL